MNIMKTTGNSVDVLLGVCRIMVHDYFIVLFCQAFIGI